MALLCKSSVGVRPLRARVAAVPCRRIAPVVCKASSKSEETASKVALPLTALVAAGLLVSGFAPEEALAARSGGRVGGGSFSSRRAAAPRSSGPSMSSGTTHIYTAPPVVVAPAYPSPFGFGMPFYGGFGFGFGLPIGGLFQFMLLSIMISVIFNVISGFVNRTSSGSSKKSNLDADEWDEL